MSGYRVVLVDLEDVVRAQLIVHALVPVIYMALIRPLKLDWLIKPEDKIVPPQMTKLIFKLQRECDYIDGHLVHIYKQQWKESE